MIKDPLDEVLLRVFRVETADVGRYIDQGITFIWKHELPKAIQCFRMALLLDPRCSFASYNLGLALFDRGDIRSAFIAFHHALDHCSQINSQLAGWIKFELKTIEQLDLRNEPALFSCRGQSQ